MADERIEKINAIAELERIGWAWESRGSNEIVLKCPVHDDINPSLNLNTKKRLFECKAAQCGFKGDIISLLAAMLHVQRSTMIEKLLEFYDLHVVKSINPERIEKWHDKIFQAGPLYQALRERGIDADLVKKARLGFHEGRITIPIYDKNRLIVNVRKYLPGAPGSEKMRDTKGYARIRFYMPEQLDYPAVWLCGGEMKALAATKFLNPEGIGALCVTSGEGAWHKDLTPKLKNKVLYICMDIDTGGITASRKLGGQLLQACKGLFIIHLPLDQAMFPKGDLNDWIMTGVKFKDFKQLMDDAHQFKIDVDEVEILEEITVRLQNAASSTNMGKKILCDGLICTMNHIPYLVPKRVKIKCGRQQPNCERCPVALIELRENGTVEMEVQGTAAGILGHIDIPEGRIREATKDALNIPPCKDVELKTLTSFAVYDSQLTAQLDVYHGGNSEHIIQPAFIVTDAELKLNMPYEFSGRVYPNPKTQQAVLLLDGVSETPDNLDSYHANDEELASLKVFQVDEFSIEGIQEKLDEIYTDLEANVTRIFCRRNLHFILDLTWHSCLHFNFDDRIQNGWINALVTGDSSQGKSEASLRLLEHYELGTRYDCKRATTAGLLGGVQQLSGRNYTTWGVIPAHDRQLVVLEEIKGMDIGVLGSLTDMRSTGIAEIVKIEKRRAHARTRLVMISNPRDNKPVASQPCGITMLSKLIGTPEDIRRFDLAIILSAMAIESSEINRLQNDCPKIPHVYTSKLCKRLILLAWTRTAEQIQFDLEATKQCITSAIHLCSTFTEVIPLVDQGTMKYKLARMAIALAIRTYSSDGDLVFVKKCHVEYVAKFIEQQYTDVAFGYDDFTMQQDFHSTIPEEATIIKEIHNTKYPKDFVNHLLVTDNIIHDDIQDWCDVDWTTSKTIMSVFSRKHCVVREGRAYNKTPAFIVLLKKMKQKGIPEHGIATGKF